ncbi:MAG TPA: peptidogalycan biosysnthesis protein [Pseudomonadota bacterium]|nr:GNAT family N-acetyltransferase [Xanthomonadales bacterium]HQX24236.1 peptidogalycan biosysnthesis protein [Pseudomonadota bacterium]MBP7417273.1 GNAT family N-acetyltransferase [Xanthomonadales bacterium]MBP8176156.1 GNAT family N-acetyltransferase [Xanthomonadales bacterium]HQY36262.1 peptidogalycan biosysnthesis protein [Pseudomonadota bacterium]
MTTLRVLPDLGAIPRADWDTLAPGRNPFVSHDFLAGLERHGCLRERLGWRPHHLGLWDGDTLVAAVPAYRKANSHGEFVFDHAWADAYERAGGKYYPKLLAAVPYSPVPGPRLLVDPRHAAARATLVDALRDMAEAARWSGAHVNFVESEDARVLRDAGWLEREDIQFHWANHGYPDFESFLGALNSKRRKEIRRERAKVRAEGWQFAQYDGSGIGAPELAEVHRLYADTFEAKGNVAALTPAFLASLAPALGPRFIVVMGTRADGARCMALFLASDEVLYGRYWGSDALAPGLHFETCYYQGIELAIARGLARFEPGAQGEHKVARGFLPVRTRSFHWLRDPALRTAVASAVARERAWVARYEQSVLAHSPYAERAA